MESEICTCEVNTRQSLLFHCLINLRLGNYTVIVSDFSMVLIAWLKLGIPMLIFQASRLSKLGRLTIFLLISSHTLFVIVCHIACLYFPIERESYRNAQAVAYSSRRQRLAFKPSVNKWFQLSICRPFLIFLNLRNTIFLPLFFLIQPAAKSYRFQTTFQILSFS